MNKDEKILLICGVLVVAALLLWSYDPKIMDQSKNEPEQPADAVIPKSSYLTYNQPYMFSPPVANVLPQTASGILGQPFPETGNSTPISDCGCSS